MGERDDSRSLRLYERIDLYRRAPHAFRINERAHALRAEWAKGFASLDDGAFLRRLRFEGFEDEDAILPVLGEIDLPEDYPSPKFVDVLRQLDASEDYYSPWVKIGRRLISSPLPQKVMFVFEASLMRDLVACGARVIAHEEDLAQVRRFRSASRLLSLHTPQDASADVSLSALVEKYPCLGRLWATRTIFWARHISEIGARLEADRALLESTFAGALGELEDVDADVSDSHHGGRRVAVLRFSSGARLLYKPKDLRVDQAFQEVLRRINARGFSPALRSIRVIDRRDRHGAAYGWVEFVPSRDCENDDQRRDFYRRSGALLALITLLRGFDFHFENIIPSGEHPVLIDLEGLCSPRLHHTLKNDISQRISESVMSTGMLPTWTADIDGKMKDLSALGARVFMQQGASSISLLPDIFVDAPGPRQAIETKVLTSTSASRVLEFEDEVQRGFRDVHALLLSVGASSALDLVGAPFADVTTRHVVRSTAGYYRLLEESRRPELLRDGLEQSIAIDRIARTLLAGVDGKEVEKSERPRAWGLLRSEHDDIANGDVPCFFVKSSSRALYGHASAPIAEDVFAQAGAERVNQTLRTLSEEDTTLESRLIALSFAARAPLSPNDVVVTPAVDAIAVPFDEALVVDHALQIARRIARGTLLYGGRRHFAGLHLDRASGAQHVALLGPHLYEGLVGIALFLGAAAYVAGGDEELRDAALSALVDPREALRALATERAIVRELHAGAFDGVGGILYVLTALGRLLEEPALIDEARRAASAITKEEIDALTIHDLFSGTAGLLLSFSAIDKMTKETTHARMIEHCADVLLRRAIHTPAGIGWPLKENRPPLCGMAHGSSGIAMALIEAWRVSDRSRQDFHDAAFSAMSYERSFRDDARGEWQDLRDVDPSSNADKAEDAERVFMTAWCNGAGGIALARAHVLSVLEVDSAVVREDLAIATRTICEAKSPKTHLCCGQTGHDEILFTLGGPELVKLARDRAMTQLATPTSTPLRGEGLMTGIAGVGYALLRRTARGARELPSVLDFDVWRESELL